MERILVRGLSAQQSSYLVAGTALVLAVIGLLTVLSATLVKAMLENQTVSPFFVKQCFSVSLAAIAAFVVSRIDYHILVQRAPALLILVWAGLIAVLVIGVDRNGARRWISLGGFSLQVSEFAKLAIVLACSWYATWKRDLISDYRRGFLPAATGLAFTVLLVAAEPDFGTSMFLLGSAFILLWLGGMRISHILVTGAMALPPFVFLMMDRFGHIMERLSVFTHGPHDQVVRGLNAMGAGGWGGRGIGEGRVHLWFLPYVESDFIFAAVGEQYGLIGTLAIVLLFVVFFWHGLKITMSAPDGAGFILAFGVTFMIVFQAAINMAVVIGLVPPKGIGLPFVSYGGSSMLALGLAVGVLLNIATQAREMRPTD